MTTILFGTEFSPLSENAEVLVIQMASAMGAKVHIVHAVEPIQGVDSDSEPKIAEFLDELRAKANAKAKPVVERFEAAGIDIELRIELGVRWRLVLEIAEEIDADMIILGTHRIRDGEKVYIGTTSHKVFFATERPLLVVPR